MNTIILALNITLYKITHAEMLEHTVCLVPMASTQGQELTQTPLDKIVSVGQAQTSVLGREQVYGAFGSSHDAGHADVLHL